MAEQLRRLVRSLPRGPISAERAPQIEDSLAHAWGELEVDGDTSMRGYKLHERAEDLHWDPPTLSFKIERHGAAAQGSTRAALHCWEINVEAATASCSEVDHRQVRAQASPWDARGNAQEVAAALQSDREDPRIRVLKDSWRREVLTSRVLPEGPRATTDDRRKRFNAELQEILGPEGWTREGRYWLPPA